ncbi:hypothetical protein FACS1894180_7940 [Bacteroidia bacterium]|nr:hypothetical protein FACS1894180_7940 [Bacteroidia bacterium]
MKKYLLISVLFLYSCIFTDKSTNYTLITEYQDSIKSNVYYYHKFLLIKEEVYNTSNGQVYTIIEYRYNKNDFDTLIVHGIDMNYDRYKRDDIVRYDFIQSKEINVLFSEIISSEISDFANVLSVAENYDDFKTDSIINGSKKTVKFIGFNKNIRFYPSYITMFIPDNTFIIDYEYTVNKNHLETEKYILDDGTLLRTYFYDKERVIKVEYLFTEKESGETFSFEKRFEYSPIFASL